MSKNKDNNESKKNYDRNSKKGKKDNISDSPKNIKSPKFLDDYVNMRAVLVDLINGKLSEISMLELDILRIRKVLVEIDYQIEECMYDNLHRVAPKPDNRYFT